MENKIPMPFEERSRKLQTVITALPVAVYDLSDEELNTLYEKLENYMKVKQQAAREVFKFALED